MPAPATDPLRAQHDARTALHFGVVRRTARIAVTALLLALAARSLLYEPFNIPSPSMAPTLLAGDYLFVAKFPYGYSRYSLPLGLALFDGRVFNRMARRGDVIVFKNPADNRTDFIKRVVGLPGDRVRMTGGQLEVNGVRIAKQPAGTFQLASGDCDAAPAGPAAAAPGKPCRAAIFAEAIDARRYFVLDQVTGGRNDDTPLVTVPQGHYFVLGDNRDDSADSRLSLADGGVGMVPAENIIGRADRIFFSIDDAASWRDPATWRGAFRLHRMGAAL